MGFVLSWTPYAVVSMYVAFVDSNANFPPLLITSLSIFGKSCLLWSSVIYVFFNNDIYSKIFTVKSLNKNETIKLNNPTQGKIFI